MTQNKHPLERLSARGEPRGAESILDAARARSADHPTGVSPLAIAAALAAFAIAGAALVLGADGESSLRTADPRPDTTSPMTTPSDPAALGMTAFGFDAEQGIVRIIDPDRPGGDVRIESLGGIRGEEGSADLSVGSGGAVVFHSILSSGCRSDVARTSTSGSSEVIVENAAHPALNSAGSLLAYSAGTECTADGDVLAVRDLGDGATLTLSINEDDDGLPMRIEDVEWIDDRIAVLADFYDGGAVARALVLYSLPSDGGPLRFDSQVPLGDMGSGTLDDRLFPPQIEPVPGDRSAVLYSESSPTDSATTLTLVDVETGELRPFVSLPGTVSSFALRSLEDLLYVTTEPKIPGERGETHTLHRQLGEVVFELATEVTTVAVPEPVQPTTVPATTEPPPPSSETTGLPRPDGAAWDAYRGALDGRIELQSELVETAEGVHRAVARTIAGDRVIDVARFDGQRWQTVSSVTLPPPDYVFGTTRAIQFGDVTGDDRPDFLIPVDAAQSIGVVISDHGGDWRALAVQTADGTATEPYLGVNPRIAGKAVISDERVCQPTCAEGGTRTVVWRYDEGVLAPSSGE